MGCNKIYEIKRASLKICHAEKFSVLSLYNPADKYTVGRTLCKKKVEGEIFFTWGSEGVGGVYCGIARLKSFIDLVEQTFARGLCRRFRIQILHYCFHTFSVI